MIAKSTTNIIIYFIAISIVKSQYFYQDDYPVFNDTLIDQQHENSLSSENYVFDQPKASILEPIEHFNPSEKEQVEELVDQKQDYPMEKNNSLDKQGQFPLDYSHNEQIKDNIDKDIEIEYMEYDYSELLNEYEDDFKEYELTTVTKDIKDTTKETLIEKVINQHVTDQSQGEKKPFNLLYIFVPVATIAALVLVVALALIFRKIAIKKRNSTTNKNFIYNPVPTGEVPRV